jgi:hypothetical protein
MWCFLFYVIIFSLQYKVKIHPYHSVCLEFLVSPKPYCMSIPQGAHPLWFVYTKAIPAGSIMKSTSYVVQFQTNYLFYKLKFVIRDHGIMLHLSL